jgi:type VI protein secretion system component VasF
MAYDFVFENIFRCLVISFAGRYIVATQDSYAEHNPAQTPHYVLRAMRVTQNCAYQWRAEKIVV